MLSIVLLVAVLVAPVRVQPGLEAGEVTVIARLIGDPSPGKLSQKDGERWLRFVLVSETGDATGPAMLGSYDRRRDVLIFTPRFRLTAGERYRATLTTETGSIFAEYRAPSKPPTKPASVAAVYPSAEEVPANLLKFYLHFSKPMREGPALFNHIKLLGEDGEEVDDPWRRTELWNADATRLTLWIHPGRIKEGVNLRDEIGPVLEPKRRYTLVVSEKLLDAEGQPLGTTFKKTFRTSDATRVAMDLKDWKLTAPKAGEKLALEVRFPSPLDHALLGRSLTVLDANGELIPGQVTVGEQERSWSFRPENAWKPGQFTLTVHERLEDLAGNTLLRPFDLNLKLPARKDSPRTIPFRVGP
ncbi:MAG: hypothetical protein K8U57_05375 [Planctomycetes bacterium]|nr:hypothetical protein [Planctomycetota bacterium]